ncbi:MAG: prolyl oligopeptidase family serine peptidase [Ramlibacter sp.]
MKYPLAALAAFATALLASACGGGGSSGNSGSSPANPEPTWARSALLNPPQSTAAIAPEQLRQRLQAGSTRDQALLLLAGDPVCEVRVQYIQYATAGGAGEHTSASGALMVPGGTDSRCTGARPIVLYGHATNPARAYNLAALTDSSNPASTEGLTLAALFAAHGFIVVAPNYTGYDSSPLTYHPFLNAQQSSGEMIDALSAAKSALPALTPRVTASAKLFVTGYSQGGHAAMATQRALQQAGVAVTAAAPMSGPYALAQELDDNFSGQVHTGATLFATMLATSFQKSYGNVYARPSDLYDSAFADGIETLLPGADAGTLANSGRLPQTALFSPVAPTAPPGSGLQATLNAMTPPIGTTMDRIYARGFGTSHLFNNEARLAYLQDMLSNPSNPRNGLRVGARANDLRGWIPLAPMLLCGGAQDASVSFSTNTLGMQRLWSGLPPGFVTVLDVDERPVSVADPFIAEKLGFAVLKEATIALARLQGDDPEWELARNYHAGAFPFCASAARRFFSVF